MGEPSDRTSDRGTALGGHRSVVKWFLRGGGSFLAAQGEATWHRTCNCSSTDSTHLWWRCLFFDCESRNPRDSAGMHQAERAGGKVYSAQLFFFSGASPATC